MKEILFVEKVIESVVPVVNPNVYLGMGFRGSDGQSSIGFGLDFLFFLFMAKKIGEHFQSIERTIFLMDKPFGCGVIDISSQEALIRDLMRLLEMDKKWRVLKFSEVFGDNVIGHSYEQTQSIITAKILEKGGYQIGWVYPDYNTYSTKRKDELYFSGRFQEYFPECKDVGFIFGKFPSIIPSYVPGPPYLVKQTSISKRILLVEKREDLEKKMTARGLIRIKKSKMAPVFEVFKQVGFSVNRNCSPLETFFDCMKQLENAIGERYRQVFY